MKVGITGATGLLGSTLMLELRHLGLEPVALTSDIRDKAAILKEVTICKPEWIVHTAAMTNVAECEKDPEAAHAVNAQGTANIVAATKQNGVRIICISTASVFKGDLGDYREGDVPEATNVYNQTKIDGEQAALKYDKAMVLRLNLVGIHPDGSRGRNFLEWLFGSIKANKDLNLFNDQRINALSNWTIASLISKIISGDVHEKVLHIGTRDHVSKAAVGKLLLEHFPKYSGSVTESSVDSLNDGAARPKAMWLNTDKAAALFGPMPTSHDEVEAIWNKLTN